MAEGVVAQVKDIPGTAIGAVRHTPILAFGIILLSIMFVVLLEVWKPGLLTGPVKSFLHMVGVKSA